MKFDSKRIRRSGKEKERGYWTPEKVHNKTFEMIRFLSFDLEPEN